MKAKIIIPAVLAVALLPWETAAALTINLGNDRDRQAERREERARERERERDREERRRDGRRVYRDRKENEFHRVLKRVTRDEDPPRRYRR